MARSETQALWRAAQTLSRRAARRKPMRIPPMFFLTDPVRTPDPLAVLARLPRGAAVIYRSFGASDAAEVAAGLARVARRRGLVLLVAADANLAQRVSANGVHLPQRLLQHAVRLRARHPNWLITAAVHDARALHRAMRAGVDAALLSPVFASRSPSAGRPLGPCRFAALMAKSRTPVYALGGVTAITARRLKDSGAAGLAAVEALTRS